VTPRSDRHEVTVGPLHGLTPGRQLAHMQPTPRTLATRVLIVLVASHLLAPPMALAYIDPISGSVILQALIAGALGALLSIKRVGFAVRAFFAQLKKRLTG
jgi:hypothetical protein